MSTRKTRFLCICQGGNVRSAGLAFALKYNYDQDALAVSAEKNTTETLKMLFRWADYVVLMSTEIPRFMHPSLLKSKKLCTVDVGPDVFGTPFHPDLQQMLAPVLAEWQRRDWDLRSSDEHS